MADGADNVTEKVPFSRVVERSICLDTNTHAWCAVCSQYERQVTVFISLSSVMNFIFVIYVFHKARLQSLTLTLRSQQALTLWLHP